MPRRDPFAPGGRADQQNLAAWNRIYGSQYGRTTLPQYLATNPDPFAPGGRQDQQNLEAWNRIYGPTLGTTTLGQFLNPPSPPQPPAPRPPAGYYDPALDAQLGASRRGIGDLRQDTELANARAAQDYTFGKEGVEQQASRDLWGVGRQVDVLNRGYQQLARRQSEGNRVAGVMSPGMLAKQMRIRAANQQFDMVPLTAQQAWINQDQDRAVGRLGLDYGRGVIDRGSVLDRGEREHTQFGLDVGEQMRYQATQAGWVPPRKPRRPS